MLIILHHLSENKLRFGELHKQLPEPTQATLPKQLRALEAYGMIIRTVYPKLEYKLGGIEIEVKEVLDSQKI